MGDHSTLSAMENEYWPRCNDAPWWGITVDKTYSTSELNVWVAGKTVIPH